MRHLHLALLCFLLGIPSTDAAVSATDDTGATVRLTQPARRIVSLAPHATELLYAAGAGTYVVGAVDFSDYPDAAKHVRRVGSYAAFDLEAIAALQPDLVIGWKTGNPAPQVEAVRALGLTLYLTEPRYLGDIPRHIELLGRLAGTEPAAKRAAAAFRTEHQRLQRRYSRRPIVSVFYQIWHQPLMTVNGAHLISDVIRLCGGQNVFADLLPLASAIDAEAVLGADPEAIVVSGMANAEPQLLDGWRRWSMLRAVARRNLFFIHPDLLQRHTPRVLQGAEHLCAALEAARARR